MFKCLSTENAPNSNHACLFVLQWLEVKLSKFWMNVQKSYCLLSETCMLLFVSYWRLFDFNWNFCIERVTWIFPKHAPLMSCRSKKVIWNCVSINIFGWAIPLTLMSQSKRPAFILPRFSRIFNFWLWEETRCLYL